MQRVNCSAGLLTKRESGLPLGSAVLKRAYRDTWGNNTVYVGEVWHDTEGRWSDGTRITTSAVYSESTSDGVTVVETQNTKYFLNSKAVHLREAAHLIHQGGITYGVHIQINTPEPPSFCLNGALFESDPKDEYFVDYTNPMDEAATRFVYNSNVDDSPGISYQDSEIQEALMKAITFYYPEYKDMVPWIFNDRVAFIDGGSNMVRTVLLGAADIIDALPLTK